MKQLRAVLIRGRGPLIYTAACLCIMLLFRDRAWQHVATINGDEWNPVQSFVRANRQGDEPICFLPTWTTGHATDQYKFRGFDLLERPEEAWQRPEPVSGFWVVSQFDAFDASTVPRDTYPHRAVQRIGAADVHLFRREPFSWPESLALRVRDASCVLHGPRGKQFPLVWGRTGYELPPGHAKRKQFGYIGCRTTEARFGGRSHLGIWFHPPPRGWKLAASWTGLKLQRWLAVSGGLRDHVAARKGAPIRLAVRLDARRIADLTFPAQRGWTTRAVDLGRAAQRGGRLTFEVSTTKNHSRHFVFDVQLHSVRPAESGPGLSKAATTTRPAPKRRGAARANTRDSGVFSGDEPASQSSRDGESER